MSSPYLKLGVDTVLYDMLPVPDYDPAKPLDSWNTPFARFPLFLDRLKIAGELGLKMAIFADVANLSSRYPKRRVLTVDEWIKVLDSALKMSVNHPAYQWEKGRPLLVHFGSDSFYGKSDAPEKNAPLPDCGWRNILAGLRQKGQQFYFVADIRPSRIDWMWDDIADGAYLFSPAGTTEFLVEYQSHTMKRLKKIPFFWSVSSGSMYEGKHYTQPDFGRIHAIYDAAIRAGVSKMILTTWNDLIEDHDIWPSCNKGSELLEIFRFYNRWFKSGKMPEIEEEKIVLAWPLRSPEKITSFSGHLWSRLLPESPGSKIITEAAPPYNVYRKEQFYPRIFFWSLLKKPRTLELCGRKYALPAGVYFGSCVFDLGRNPKRIPVTARVSGDTIELPAIQRVPVEFKDGGLEHRYFDLLRKPACNLLTGRRLDVANAAALAVLRDMGFSAAYVSPELSREDFLALPGQSPLPLGMVLSGFWPVGISRFGLLGIKPNEPFLSPKGEVFWARTYGGNVWIYPGWALDLSDKRQELQAAGYSFFARLEEHVPQGLPEARRPGLFNWEGSLL